MNSILISLLLTTSQAAPAAIQLPEPYATVLKTELGSVTNPTHGQSTYCNEPAEDGWMNCVQTSDWNFDWSIDQACVYDEFWNDPLNQRNYNCYWQ